MSISKYGSTALALLMSAVLTGPSLDRAVAAPGVDPAPVVVPTTPPAKATTTPTTTTTDPVKSEEEKKRWWQKKEDKKSSVDDPAFLKGYRAAYAAIFERSEYALAIPQLEALGQNDRADVANLIGYSYRKLGNYQLAGVWYERALKADPNHVRTWQYYGLWQVEQGNREQALYHLGKIEQITGRNNEEYRSLAAALTTGRASY